MQTYIYSCNKESKKCASHPELSTVHFENCSNITVYSAGVIPKEKHNESEKSRMENCKILKTN